MNQLWNIFPVVLAVILQLTKCEEPNIFAPCGEGNPCMAPNGLFPSPDDCAYFYNCAHCRAYKQICAAGTVFNAQAGICDFPHKVTCFSQQSVHSQYASNYQPGADQLPDERRSPRLPAAPKVHQDGIGRGATLRSQPQYDPNSPRFSPPGDGSSVPVSLRTAHGPQLHNNHFRTSQQPPPAFPPSGVPNFDRGHHQSQYYQPVQHHVPTSVPEASDQSRNNRGYVPRTNYQAPFRNTDQTQSGYAQQPNYGQNVPYSQGIYPVQGRSIHHHDHSASTGLHNPQNPNLNQGHTGYQPAYVAPSGQLTVPPSGQPGSSYMTSDNRDQRFYIRPGQTDSQTSSSTYKRNPSSGGYAPSYVTKVDDDDDRSSEESETKFSTARPVTPRPRYYTTESYHTDNKQISTESSSYGTRQQPSYENSGAEDGRQDSETYDTQHQTESNNQSYPAQESLVPLHAHDHSHEDHHTTKAPAFYQRSNDSRYLYVDYTGESGTSQNYEEVRAPPTSVTEEELRRIHAMERARINQQGANGGAKSGSAPDYMTRYVEVRRDRPSGYQNQPQGENQTNRNSAPDFMTRYVEVHREQPSSPDYSLSTELPRPVFRTAERTEYQRDNPNPTQIQERSSGPTDQRQVRYVPRGTYPAAEQPNTGGLRGEPAGGYGGQLNQRTISLGGGREEAPYGGVQPYQPRSNKPADEFYVGESQRRSVAVLKIPDAV